MGDHQLEASGPSGPDLKEKLRSRQVLSWQYQPILHGSVKITILQNVFYFDRLTD